MRIKFWGVRGSTPTPAAENFRYGGNTSCVEVRSAKGEIIIFDCGTGFRSLGKQLLREFGHRSLQAYIFLSHYHWDHIQGIPFFDKKRNSLDVIPMIVGQKNVGLKTAMAELPQELLAQRTKTRAAIKNDDFAFCAADLHAGRVAAVTKVLRRRSGCGTAYSPELDPHVFQPLSLELFQLRCLAQHLHVTICSEGGSLQR